MLELWQTYGVYLWSFTALAAAGLAGAVLILWKRLNRAVGAYMRLTEGADSVRLDELLEERSSQVQQHHAQLEHVEQRLSALERESLCRIALLRFNPFDDVGGDQSFSLALLDGRNNGLVLSSIYTRSGTRLYAKPIQEGRSSHHLSDEEVAAVNRAISAEPALVELSA